MWYLKIMREKNNTMKYDDKKFKKKTLYSRVLKFGLSRAEAVETQQSTKTYTPCTCIEPALRSLFVKICIAMHDL